jgi:hypothetical protein
MDCLKYYSFVIYGCLKILSVTALEVYVGGGAKYHSNALFPLGAVSVHTTNFGSTFKQP